MNNIENKLGIRLPEVPKSMDNFLPYLLEGSNLYIFGKISIDKNGRVIQGKLGDLARGKEAAKYVLLVFWHELRPL